MESEKIEILMIEDDQSQAELIMEMLAGQQRQWYLVQHVHYLAQGLEAMGEKSFDCVLVDLGLPDSQGLESALAVRRQAREVSIVVLTVLDDEESARAALKFDIQDYLIKGEINSAVLTRSIRYALQRKAVAERLARSEERLRLATEAAEVGLWNWDLVHDDLTMDEQTKALFGFAADSHPSYADFLESIHSEDRAAVEAGVTRALKEKADYSEEMRAVTPDGTLRWVISKGRAFYDEHGEPLRLDGISMDITQRKQGEEALKSSELKFSRIFAAAPALIIFSSMRDGTIIDVNQQALETLGYEREELLGRKLAEVPMWMGPFSGQEVVQDLISRRTVRELEMQYRCRAGDTITGLLAAEIIEVGGEECLLMLVRDITERKLTEQRVRQLNAELQVRAADLEAANKELEAFNYTVAHDLRQPLNVIYGYCQAIEIICGGQIAENCREYLQDTYRGIQRMTRLLDSLLDFSRMSRVQPARATVDLSTLARGVAKELRDTEPQRVVTFRIPDGIEADGDPALLELVLRNLIGNAWKYTAREREAVIELGVTEVNGSPTYFVRDNGPGFQPEDAEKLFLPFQRLAAAAPGQGFGIGLATVDRIIARHGGRVWAEGEPGKGATFFFTLNGNHDQTR